MQRIRRIESLNLRLVSNRGRYKIIDSNIDSMGNFGALKLLLSKSTHLILKFNFDFYYTSSNQVIKEGRH